jgi:hypothetical protein
MASAVAELEGRPVVVSGGGDGTVRVWDLASGASVAEQPTGPVTGLAGCGHGRLMHDDGLVPVAPGMQEAGNGGGDQHGVPVPSGGGGMAGARVQVGALGVQPGGCLPGRGY